jgi:tetratricopeptide (TPR) repeat protein
MAGAAHLNGQGIDGTGTEPPLVAEWGDPRLREAAERLYRDGDGTAALAYVARSPSWDVRQHVVEVLSDRPGRPPQLDAWAQGLPDTPLPFLVRGTQAIRWAWEARGTGWAETVSEEAWQQFFDRLQQAEADFRRAAELDPNDPLPHAQLIATGLALELEREELHSRFEAALARYPAHRAAHDHYFTTYERRWGGSHEEMFDFAVKASDRAPMGSGVATLIPKAHVAFLADLRLTQGAVRPEVYFPKPAIRVTVLAAYRRSLASPRHQDTPFTVSDRNYFAFCLFHTGDHAFARAEFQRLAGRMTPAPWNLGGEDPATIFREAARQLRMEA